MSVWIITDILRCGSDDPLYPESGTFARVIEMSALCQIADIAEIELNKQKDRLAAVFVNLTRLFLPFGLNNRRFALANRSFTFTYAPRKGQRREP